MPENDERLDNEETKDLADTAQDVEESVRDEGRDEAAVIIARIDAKLDAITKEIGRISARIDAMPTFESAVDDGAIITDFDASGAVEVAVPTSDISDLDLTI